MNKKFYICAALFLIFIFSESIAFGAEKAILVTQPAYHSMNFYVYKPANVPSEYFATYDGFLVYKDTKGIWHYASFEKSGIKKTGYVVGAVIPSVVKITPYNEKISSVAPILGTDKAPEPIAIKPAGTRVAPNEKISMEIDTPEILEIDVTPITGPEIKSPKISYTPPPAGLEISNYIPGSPEWTQNSNFMAISKWQNSIDRIGVLDRPKTPVAWKGDYPEVIYAWTGMQWQQNSTRNRHLSALKIIRREQYNLVVSINKLNVLNWTDEDTSILSQYSTLWGYQWLGQILINKE